MNSTGKRIIEETRMNCESQTTDETVITGNAVSIGNQGFDNIRKNNSFYVDKTALVKEWWESGDAVTLITRPRRFGKTLNMSMLNCFFSMKYEDRGDLFEGLSVWQEEKYRKLQGTYPVISISFADVKQTNYKDAVQKIKNIIAEAYADFPFLYEWEGLLENQKQQLKMVTGGMDDVTAQDALKNLSCYLNRYYGQKVLVLLDEYDTPMQEAYIHGYWEEFTAFVRCLFNSTFKTNPYLERAMMTGITRVSKESIFSDLNNLNVVTTTSKEYETCFGFTQEEVFAALERFGLQEQKEEVRDWYDGFSFGAKKAIYNPWSITNFLDKREFRPYWAATSSNSLVSRLLQTAEADIKEGMEDLVEGREITVSFDEQVVFDQLDRSKDAIWSLLVAGGYLRIESIEYRGMLRKAWYHLKITNLETMGMFADMFASWFQQSAAHYNEFIDALLKGNVKEMNAYMNDVALAVFSSFDTGKHPSERTQPEKFYYGFVLGLLVELKDSYEVKSNRESGFGRYDIMLIPRNRKAGTPAMVLEFKIQEKEEESSLEATVESALKQIREKQYDTELLEAGIKMEDIRHYGFAFEGKRVLIG